LAGFGFFTGFGGGFGLCGFGGLSSIRFSVSLNLVSSSFEEEELNV
jgi:hypothetical protein